MIAIGLFGVVALLGFVAWVVFREPWLAGRGDPAGPHAQHRAEQLRTQQRSATLRALARLRDERDASDGLARADSNGSSFSP
jgi:hypothetical protein